MNEGFRKNKEQFIDEGGKGGIGRRYDGFKEFQKTGKPIEMAEVGLDHNNPEAVNFNNGRHRFSVMRDQGVKTIPVAVIKEHADEFKRRFGA